MAVAIASNSAAGSKTANGATSLTISYDAGSGTDRYLLVPVLDVAGDTVTGVTYGGVAMTQLTKASRGPNNVGSLQGYIYGLHAPTSGTNDIVITRSGTTAWLEGGAVLLTGANQSTAVSVTVTTQGPATGSPKSQAITTTEDNSAVIGLICNDNATVTVGTGGTLLFIGGGGGFESGFSIFRSSTFPYTPAGALTVNWTQDTNGSWFIMMVSIAEASAVATKKRLTTLGVS